MRKLAVTWGRAEPLNVSPQIKPIVLVKVVLPEVTTILLREKRL
jgi:hypothetical protein